MRSRVVQFVLAGLIILLAVSIWRMVSVDQERKRLSAAYTQAQQTLQQLETERAHLNDELVGAHETIEKQTGDLANLQQELKDLGARLERTTTELTSLQREHEQLRQSNASLATEKQQLEAKLSSIKELKLAIRGVKRKMGEERRAAWQVHIQEMKVADTQRLASGNRGYLLRNGTPTAGSHATVKVHVLEPQSR